METTTLERGILAAFRLFVAARFLLWLLLYSRGDNFAMRPVVSAFGIQVFGITALLDALLLLALCWPHLSQTSGKRIFALLFGISSGVLLFGHAGMLSFRDLAGSPNALTFSTPYVIFLFTAVLFVGWQYDLRAVLLYGGGVTALLLLLLWHFDLLTIELAILTLFVALLTMLLPGWLIAHMMAQQRHQQADLAAASAEQARMNQQLVYYAASLEELTISRERNRLARELHDTLAHSLSAVAVQLGAVETLWEQNPPAAKALLAQADESARDGLQEARRALQALRASPLEDLGLVLALAALAQEAAERAGTALTLHLPEDNLSFLAAHIEQSIYRIAQEALENCVRHAEAKQIWVTLTVAAALITLTIHDDGAGFDVASVAPTTVPPTTVPPSGSANHYGLAGMWERASMIGGTLTVESAQVAGTTIQLCFALSDNAKNRVNPLPDNS